jgi:3-methyladenine DNA glycosylase AlkD
MTAKEVLDELKKMGTPAIKKVLMNHGAKEPFYGVKVQDLKKIQKKVKKDYKLSMELYKTGISDAMYLAGLIADESKMSKQDIQQWADGAYWSMISEYTVPWVASESKYGYELALEWIESKKENIAVAGWNTLSALVTIKPDAELDLKKIKSLLARVEKEIHTAPNRVRYTMNGFIIAVGGYVVSLHNDAVATAKKIGTVTVDMEGTACKVPAADGYIEKMKQKGYLGKKRKTVKC